MRRTLSALCIILSIFTALAALGRPVGTAFTYQGQLKRDGNAFNGTCDFQFSLWDAASAGTQQGSTLPINGVNVVNGLFTVALDFGDAFTGDPRWLGASVQCSGDGGFTQLDPRQPITAAPYALSLRPGARILGGSFVDTTFEAESTGGIGVKGVTLAGTGVFGYGETFISEGVRGENVFGIGVQGTGRTGVFGSSNNRTTPAIGVHGTTTHSSGSGVQGDADGANAAGVFGLNSAGPGIWGRSTADGAAVYGQAQGTGLAGRFTGSVLVEGNLIVQGGVFKNGGNFRIDHPLDPANKFLSHSFIESPDMMNIYNGNVTTDASGSATVTLPDYFAALNRDYRYQLTVLGQFAQAIVSRKIDGNSFEIRTDKPGVEVSWQVTGIRQDAYAQANPIVVEESKPAEEQGLYLYPAGFGAGEEKGIGYSSRPATAPGPQEQPGAGPSDPASK